jgi:hypothetical protein
LELEKLRPKWNIRLEPLKFWEEFPIRALIGGEEVDKTVNLLKRYYDIPGSRNIVDFQVKEHYMFMTVI